MDLELAKEVRDIAKEISGCKKFLMQTLGRKMYVGHEKRENWAGKLPFYIFWCSECEHFAKDYPHGHLERQYLICSFCAVRHDFVPWWMPFAELFATLKFVWKYRVPR